MGYDMHWVQKDPEERKRVDAANADFRAAVAIRDAIPKEEHGHLDFDRAKELGLSWDDVEALVGASDRFKQAQQVINEAYERMYREERSYFRLNIWGMGKARRIMYQAGMIFDDDPDPQWPKAEEFGITSEQYWAHQDPEAYPEEVLTAEQHAAAERHKEAIDMVRRHHWAERPGIPSRKFGSNDGWIVTPAEAKAAVAIWRQYERLNPVKARAMVEEELDWDLWNRWIDYLAESAKWGGFEVW